MESGNLERTKLKKNTQFKHYNAPKKGGKTAEAEDAKAAYNNSKHIAKHTILLAKSKAEKQTLDIVSFM